MKSVFNREIEVPSLLKPQNRDEQEHLTELIETVALKMTERFRNQSQAFRAFDATGKGKVFKSHFVESLERLRIRLSAQDISKIWACLDPQRRGYITFNEFCILQHLRTSKHQDPFNTKALETKVLNQRA